MSDPLRKGSVRPPAVLILVIATVLTAAGCGTSVPSPSPTDTPTTPAPTTTSAPSASPSPAASADVDAVYDEIEAQVVEIRGLQPTGDVARRIIDETELRAILTAKYDEETPLAYIAGSERLYKALGLIAEDASLRDLALDMLSGGVDGFYVSEEQTLYVVSETGLPGPLERIAFAHEYAHALQDQHTTVFEDQDGILDQSDQIMARQAIYEGDASVVMGLWGQGNFDLSDLAALLELASDPEQLALLERMPAIIEEPLLFPYTTGLTYVQMAQLQGGWEAVDAFYERMPVSTEQILHPEAYAANEAPVEVDLPDELAAELGNGWSVPIEDTFGEFQLGIWLRESGIGAEAAETATTGWGGDRLAVLDGPGDAWGVVLETAWDSTTDAGEFGDAAQTAVDGLANPARIATPADDTVTILIASDEASLLALDVIFGATGV